MKENNSDRLKEINQEHDRQSIKILTLDDFNLKDEYCMRGIDILSYRKKVTND